MNIQQLQDTLKLLAINDARYSLNGELKTDAFILYPNYAKWEVFYLDERGSRREEKVFYSESEACEYLLKRIESILETEKKFGIKLT